MKTLLALFLFIAPFAYSQDARSICVQINRLNDKILQRTIKKQQAVVPFKTLIAQLSSTLSFKATPNWTFPLQGYLATAIGGFKGNGYSNKGYNFFDGNKHLAHPAHDIFINDRNQDDIDDKTNQPVNVLAVADGIVLACSNDWDSASNLRGGRYIWLYHPQINIVSYYAHNRIVLVKPGDEVTQGQKIAEVGRTGFNAFKKRSPTHLHFGAYYLSTGVPLPFNPYSQLKKALTK